MTKISDAVANKLAPYMFKIKMDSTVGATAEQMAEYVVEKDGFTLIVEGPEAQVTELVQGITSTRYSRVC